MVKNMNLYLMQHGIANPKEIDIDESLSDEGVKKVITSAKALKKLNISFDAIICSPKKRSFQTAKIIAKEFNFKEDKIIQTENVKPMSDPKETINFIKQYERIFIAGHLPNIKEVIFYLLNQIFEIDIQNAGCTFIEIKSNKSILKWHLTNDILKNIIN
jgi:phosphohistidine phosphatase